jgi:hypothetical protein
MTVTASAAALILNRISGSLIRPRMRLGMRLCAVEPASVRVILGQRRRSSLAEDRRFELLRGCPQHAFQQCCPTFTAVQGCS